MTVPTSGNASLGFAVRRLLLLDLASRAVGGAAKLGEALGISRRAVNHKLASDRALTNDDIAAAADAVERRAAELQRLAAELRGLIA